jgi:hypothetical protein
MRRLLPIDAALAAMALFGLRYAPPLVTWEGMSPSKLR